MASADIKGKTKECFSPYASEKIRKGDDMKMFLVKLSGGK